DVPKTSSNRSSYAASPHSLSALMPPWAHVGRDAKLIERLHDDATRRRIRRDMLIRSDKWHNEWQEIRGPQDVMISAVQNPQPLPLQGKTLTDIAKLWGRDPIDTLFDLLVRDKAFT